MRAPPSAAPPAHGGAQRSPRPDRPGGPTHTPARSPSPPIAADPPRRAAPRAPTGSTRRLPRGTRSHLAAPPCRRGPGTCNPGCAGWTPTHEGSRRSSALPRPRGRAGSRSGGTRRMRARWSGGPSRPASRPGGPGAVGIAEQGGGPWAAIGRGRVGPPEPCCREGPVDGEGVPGPHLEGPLERTDRLGDVLVAVALDPGKAARCPSCSACLPRRT